MNADPGFTKAELELIRRALTIPECWNPGLRGEAAEIINLELARRAQQQSLFAASP